MYISGGIISNEISTSVERKPVASVKMQSLLVQQIIYERLEEYFNLEETFILFYSENENRVQDDTLGFSKLIHTKQA